MLCILYNPKFYIFLWHYSLVSFVARTFCTNDEFDAGAVEKRRGNTVLTIDIRKSLWRCKLNSAAGVGQLANKSIDSYYYIYILVAQSCV